MEKGNAEIFTFMEKHHIEMSGLHKNFNCLHLHLNVVAKIRHYLTQTKIKFLCANLVKVRWKILTTHKNCTKRRNTAYPLPQPFICFFIKFSSEMYHKLTSNDNNKRYLSRNYQSQALPPKLRHQGKQYKPLQEKLGAYHLSAFRWQEVFAS